jgi:hypothetical protein
MNLNTNFQIPFFNRNFFNSEETISCIGDGSIGGKARGLAFIQKTIVEKINKENFSEVEFDIPRFVVLRTQIFDLFLERNKLYEIAYSDKADESIIQAFLQAELPVEILGDLLSIAEQLRAPLAIRSSSFLEDNQYEPFAGIFATKMIPNNQPSSDARFHKLVEAIKYVFASTFFKESKNYFKITSPRIQEEKMAVIIQEVVGQRYDERFYPNISGVLRSYNHYPSGKAKPHDGVANLALGLGKTVVDDGIAWSYSPAYPNAPTPYAGTGDMLKITQTKFWAINMSPLTEYNPVSETEFMVNANLKDADYDNTLNYIASTYDISSDKFIMGTDIQGPRCINFLQLLSMNEFRFNELIRKVLNICEDEMNCPVEIEFAVNISKTRKKMHFGFLQVRPMVLSDENVELSEEELFDKDVLIASNRTMGNGIVNNIRDIVFVKPEVFNKQDTKIIASQISSINKDLSDSSRLYLLIGFGRWGSSDPWLGIPIEWAQISGAKVIVEATLSGMNVELSQGSHFFHNLTSFKVNYFTTNFDGQYKIDWEWLNQQQVVAETDLIKHVKTISPLKIIISGQSGRGVIKKP